MEKNRAVFIDRDGTIIVEKHFLSDPAGVELIAGSGEAIHTLNSAGYRVFGVSNQSGVARGYFDERAVRSVNDEVVRQVADRGGKLEEIFHCPHHPRGTVPALSIACDCRKPQPGMIQAAEEKYGLAPMEAVVIGDRICDVDLGKGIGAKTILVLTGYGVENRERIVKEGLAEPDHYADDLAQAVAALLKDR